MSRLHGRLQARSGGNGALTEALMLDNWLRELTFYGAYPIPWQAGEIGVLSRMRAGQGILYCWTHLPLVEMPLRALADLGHSVDLIVAHPGKIVGKGEFIVPGCKDRIKTISVDKRVLIKVKTGLAEGKSVACLADAEIFGPLSPQVLHIAGMVGAFVIFLWAERLADGTITVTILPAPHPLCESEEKIDENLEFLRTMNRTILTELGVSFEERPLGDRKAD